jgi:hypothetical protein
MLLDHGYITIRVSVSTYGVPLSYATFGGLLLIVGGDRGMYMT